MKNCKLVKSNLLITLVLSLSAFSFDFNSFADSFTYEGLNYNWITGDIVEVGKNPNVTGEITIPVVVKLNGSAYRVSAIGDGAFLGCKDLNGVYLAVSYAPDNLTRIGDKAFMGSGVTNACIPRYTKTIGNFTFYNCQNISTINIPLYVTSIGQRAFSCCSAIKHIYIDDSNYKYDSREDCDAIIETATNTLIAGCKNTIIPNSVTSIGDYAFEGCSGLTSITIPNSVTTIGDHAFYDCYGLTSVHITDLAKWCNISFKTVLANPLYFAHHLFLNGNEVKDLVIPNSVTSIGDHAFNGCSGLTSVTIPNSVTSIGNYAFIGCSSLTSIKVASGNTKYDSRNNCKAIIETASNTLITGCKNSIIPNSVTSICDYAFSGCSGLTNVTIPNSVTSIGGRAFNDCSSLNNIYCYINHPNDVLLGNSVFDGVDKYHCVLHVIAGRETEYRNADQWKDFGNIIGDIYDDGSGGTIPNLDSLEVYTPTVENGELCVFYEAPINRSVVTVWAWNSSTNFTGGSWPGQNARLMGKTADDTRLIFKWTCNDSWSASNMPTGIIFSNAGSIQTADLEFKNHGYYIDGIWDHEVTEIVDDAPTVSINLPSGNYTGQQSISVTITASSNTATIVYTTDGTMPTPSSQHATGTVTLNFTSNTTLKAGVLHEGQVRNVVTSEYILNPLTEHTATVYVKDPTVAPWNWTSVYYWAWNNNGNLCDNTSWPGDEWTTTKMIKGEKFYYKSFTSTDPNFSFNFIFSQNGSPQTVDLGPFSKDVYLELDTYSSKWTVKDITAQYATLTGDVNGDGRVNVSDVSTLINMILGMTAIDQNAADVNGDGRVNVSDVTALVNIILGII